MPRTSEERNRYFKKIYYSKKDKGICISCNEEATDGVFCRYHYIKKNDDNRKYYKRNAEKEKDRKKRSRMYFKKNGMCITCGTLLDEEIDLGRVKCVNCSINYYSGRQ